MPEPSAASVHPEDEIHAVPPLAALDALMVENQRLRDALEIICDIGEMKDGVPRSAHRINATYYKRAEDCPDAAKHTKSPDGYIQWHAWAEKKAKTHTQHRCPTCGFWSIWKRKRKAAA